MKRKAWSVTEGRKDRKRGRKMNELTRFLFLLCLLTSTRTTSAAASYSKVDPEVMTSAFFPSASVLISALVAAFLCGLLF